MIAVLVVLLVAAIGFVGYVVGTKARGSSPLSAASSPKRGPAGKGAPAQDEYDEEEATTVRIIGPSLVRTLGGVALGEEIPVGNGVKIGRGQASTLRLQDSELSAAHAEVRIERGVPVLVDLESTNGTFLNEKQISPNVLTVLKDGDQIRVGKTQLIFKNPK